MSFSSYEKKERKDTPPYRKVGGKGGGKKKKARFKNRSPPISRKEAGGKKRGAQFTALEKKTLTTCTAFSRDDAKRGEMGRKERKKKKVSRKRELPPPVLKGETGKKGKGEKRSCFLARKKKKRFPCPAKARADSGCESPSGPKVCQSRSGEGKKGGGRLKSSAKGGV